MIERPGTRSAWRALAALMAAAWVGAAAGKKPTPSPSPTPATVRPSVTVDRAGDADRWDVALDGRLVAWVTLSSPGETSRLAVLLAKTEGLDASPSPSPCETRASSAAAAKRDSEQRRLVIFEPTAEGRLESLRDDLHADIGNLAARDLDGDGRDDLVLVGRGRLYGLLAGENRRFAGTPVPLASDPRVTPEGLLRGSREGGRQPVRVSAVGAVLSFVPGEPGLAWRSLDPIPLDVSTWSSTESLVLWSPALSMSVTDGAGHLWGATRAEEVGTDRFRLRFAELDPAEAARSEECWARLPSPERLVDQALVLLDREPAFVVTTTTAEKLSLFGEKNVRVYRLAGDRTRTGSAPILAGRTTMNLWQPTTPHVADVDGDGRDDLVLPYWKGLKDAILAFDVFTRRADGSFPPEPRSSSFDVRDGTRGVLLYGDDVDGDRVGDTIVLSGREVRAHLGVAPAEAPKRVVAERPGMRSEVPEPLAKEAGGDTWFGFGPEGAQSGTSTGGLGAPRTLRLGADPGSWLLWAGTDGEGFGRLLLLRWRPKPPAR